MVHKAHKSKEQRQNIRTDERARHNAIQLEFEYCKNWNIGQEEGWIEEEACEVRDDGGIEDVSSNEWGVTKVGFVGSQYWIWWWRAAIFARHFDEMLILLG